MKFARTLLTGDVMEPVTIGLRFIDLLAHVAPGTSLRHIGKLINRPKLDILPPYSIERMDEYLREDPAGFEAYAMRDAEIARPLWGCAWLPSSATSWVSSHCRPPPAAWPSSGT